MRCTFFDLTSSFFLYYFYPFHRVSSSLLASRSSYEQHTKTRKKEEWRRREGKKLLFIMKLLFFIFLFLLGRTWISLFGSCQTVFFSFAGSFPSDKCLTIGNRAWKLHTHRHTHTASVGYLRTRWCLHLFTHFFSITSHFLFCIFSLFLLLFLLLYFPLFQLHLFLGFF